MKILKALVASAHFYTTIGLVLRLFRTKMDFVGLFSKIHAHLGGFSITATAPLLRFGRRRWTRPPAAFSNRHTAELESELTPCKEKTRTFPNRNKIQSIHRPILGVRKRSEDPVSTPLTPWIQICSLRVLKPVMQPCYVQKGGLRSFRLLEAHRAVDSRRPWVTH
jgi:hypothetical protein